MLEVLSSPTHTHTYRNVHNWLKRPNISRNPALKAQPIQTVSLTNAYLLWRSAAAYGMDLTPAVWNPWLPGQFQLSSVFRYVLCWTASEHWHTEGGHTRCRRCQPFFAVFRSSRNSCKLLSVNPRFESGVFAKYIKWPDFSVPSGGRLSRCNPALSGMPKGRQHLQTLQLH